MEDTQAQLLYIDTVGLSDASLKHITGVIPPQWVDRALKFKAEKQKNLRLAAGYLLFAALNGYGLDTHSLTLKCGEYGKPYIAGNPLYFNLSHSGDIAVCAVAADELGVDIQYLKSPSPTLLKKVCTQSERQTVKSCPSPDEYFTRLWTVKESYLKYTGRGLSLSPILLETELNATPSLKVVGRNCGVFFKEYALSGYKLTLCRGVPVFPPPTKIEL